MIASAACMGHLGFLAARRGDEAAWEASLVWLDRRTDKYLSGRHRYAQARIAAEPGDGDQAADLRCQKRASRTGYSVPSASSGSTRAALWAGR
jgi:hypothetical protein